ncbi:MAG TPA: single-stranded-DNA-specific exonuclease RecJ [Gemmatimonadaceae bacterium]|nr:single-stranded-DNA-specific exonuclease RecJ [Gemmatimonadaceae bacterium]
MSTFAARMRPEARWSLPAEPEPAAVVALAQSLRLPETLAALLIARGRGDPEAAKAFLRPRLEQLHPPLSMRGMDRAVERLTRAIRDGETILVHGDYDVDGMCSTTILVRTIRHLGGTVTPFIPHRLSDGYDLTEAGVRAAAEIGARVVITCDCGTSAHAAVDALVRQGVDVIISDHHLPGEAPPECLAVLNPRVMGCDYPDKDLCAAGVAFKLAVALLEAHGASVNVAYHMLDLVALATVADVAPLRGENRILVRYGLRMMNDTKCVGLRALIQAAGLEGRELTAGRIAYLLAPRLNAVGRLGHALRGVELLLSTDVAHANAIARELEELNRTRQSIDRATLDQARKLTEALDPEQTFGVVLGAEGWHPGVIGIVASRLVEELYRPVVLVAIDSGVGKGSGRSIPAFDLHAGLTSCADVLLRYGGHRAAAGLTMEASRLPELAERFNAAARACLAPEDLVPELRVDLEVPLLRVNEDLETLLRHFEPYGIGNPAPVLVSRGVKVSVPPRLVGENGVKFRLADGPAELEGVWWAAADRAPEFPAGSAVDIAYRLERDVYRGTSRLVARLADVRR